MLGLGLGLASWRRRPVLGVLIGFCLAEVLAPVLGASVFGLMRVAAWTLFVALPLALLIRGWQRPRWAALGALPLLLVALDAFLIEPRDLEITHLEVPSPKIRAPVRLALVADVQTDRVGGYEREVFQAVMAEAPDLVLYAGDYIQAPVEETEGQHRKLNELFRQTGLGSVPGVAVEGDIDRSGWRDVFAGTRVSTATGAYELGQVVVTAWSPEDSRREDLWLTPPTEFHVALGHSPDFVRSEGLHADLVVAGHVHGGQVQLPWYGPLMTLSALPREQTHGHTLRDDGTHLVVSRGIGLERRDAPRLRFLCKPEVVILDLVPG